MPPETPVMDIIRLCRESDETARDAYLTLHTLCEGKPIASFWAAMAKAETEHVDFWKRAERVEAFSDMPSLFDDPDKVIAELRNALSRARLLLRSCEEDFSLSKAFTLAFRMEFYLLHPAFVLLFHLMGPAAGGTNPEKAYEAHIDGLIAMLAKYGNATPELELLGEALQRLWKENKHLALQSTRDDLTGVLNRRGFFAIAVPFAHLSQRTRSTVGILMIDLDHFKAVNDRLGHPAGDRVLKGTATLLTQALRASDVVGRYGGEEFIVMLPAIGAGTAERLAEKLRRTVEEHPPEGIPLTVSVGFAHAVLGTDVRADFQHLIQKADTALYQAKNAGRNRVMEYRPHDE